ncbi:MAG: hypothetical protein WA915_11520 [Candidatus Aminicenantaceae bacterium]
MSGARPITGFSFSFRYTPLLLFFPASLNNLDYSRVEANPPHPNIKVEAVAHEAVVNYREPTQPTRATTKAL